MKKALGFRLLTLGLTSVLGLSGCAKDAQLLKVNIPESHKSTTAENVTAYGNIAAGAWDRLFTQKGSE